MSENFRIGPQEPVVPIPPQPGARAPSSLEAAIELVLRTHGIDEHTFKMFEETVKRSSTPDLLNGLRLLDEKRREIGPGFTGIIAAEQLEKIGRMRDIIITELLSRGIDLPYPPAEPLRARGDEAVVRSPATGAAAAELPLDGIVSEKAKKNLAQLGDWGKQILAKLETADPDEETQARLVDEIKILLAKAADDPNLGRQARTNAAHWYERLLGVDKLEEAARVFERGLFE